MERKNIRLNLERLYDAGCRNLKYGGIISVEQDPVDEDNPRFKIFTTDLKLLATEDDEFVITQAHEEYVCLKCIALDTVLWLSKTEFWIATQKEEEFQVKIPGGYLLVEAVGAEGEYPGVYISFSKDGEKTCGENPVTLVEYDTLKGRIQTVCYKPGCEEPTTILPYDSDEIDEEEIEYTAATDLSHISKALKNDILKNHQKLIEKDKERNNGQEV